MLPTKERNKRLSVSQSISLSCLSGVPRREKERNERAVPLLPALIQV